MLTPETFSDDFFDHEADLAAYERDAGAFRPSDLPSVDPRWDEEDERLHASVAAFLGYGSREAV